MLHNEKSFPRMWNHFADGTFYGGYDFDREVCPSSYTGTCWVIPGSGAIPHDPVSRYRRN